MSGTGAPSPTRRILLLTGMSGAGKTSALKMLEDMGWEVVDNLPLALLDGLVKLGPATGAAPPPLAVGVDTRTRGFDPAIVVRYLRRLRRRKDPDVGLVFLAADAEVLQRRFTETRRRHPLAQDRTVIDGVRHENHLLSGLRDTADLVIDTTDLSLPDLRRMLGVRFATERRAGLHVFVTSFSYGRGLPRDADLVMDVRFLKNPHYQPELKARSGKDEDVGRHIRTDSAWARFEREMAGLLAFLLPRYGREGKSYLTIAFGCTGGRHRSVFCAEHFAARLREADRHVTVRHRDLARKATPVSAD